MNNLPPLTGTPKQVAWASSIRKEKMGDLHTWLMTQRWTVNGVRPFLDKFNAERDCTIFGVLGDWLNERGHRILSAACYAVRDFAAITDSHYWIDNRECTVRFMLSQLGRKYL